MSAKRRASQQNDAANVPDHFRSDKRLVAKLFVSLARRTNRVARVLAGGALLLQGCVSTSPRFQNAAGTAPKSVLTRDGYSLAFVEFGEQGSYLDTTQIEAAVKFVRDARKPLVITYVHGWHNDSGSNDVTRFSDFLAQVASTPLIKGQGFQVIGVYLGWRGEITTVPILNETTFYSRKAAAERLASNFDCFDAISSIAEAARKHRDRYSQYTVLLGHSFGGLVVERAVAHALDARMHGRGSKMPADLTLVWNPASDSILSRQIISALNQWNTQNARPMFVSITSSADSATGTIFPIATNLASLTKSFPEVADPGTNKKESERNFFTSTPGHNAALINYQAEPFDLKYQPPVGTRSALELNLSYKLPNDRVALPNDTNGIDLWNLRRISTIDVPYWNIQVDKRIIRNHGDIWNPKAEALLAGLFRIANPLHPARNRAEASFSRRDFRRGAYQQSNAAPAPTPTLAH